MQLVLILPHYRNSVRHPRPVCPQHDNVHAARQLACVQPRLMPTGRLIFVGQHLDLPAKHVDDGQVYVTCTGKGVLDRDLRCGRIRKVRKLNRNRNGGR